jgi:hypothetical protein
VLAAITGNFGTTRSDQRPPAADPLPLSPPRIQQRKAVGQRLTLLETLSAVNWTTVQPALDDASSERKSNL